MIDYVTLLRKYMNEVAMSEGTDFVEFIDAVNPATFTAKEYNELKRISDLNA